MASKRGRCSKRTAIKLATSTAHLREYRFCSNVKDRIAKARTNRECPDGLKLLHSAASQAEKHGYHTGGEARQAQVRLEIEQWYESLG